MNLEEFKTTIQGLSRYFELIEETDELMIYTIGEYELSASKSELLSIIESIGDYKSDNETDIYSDNYYEILVRFNSRRTISMRYSKSECLSKADQINKINYEISPASDKYVIIFLNSLNSISQLRVLRRRILLSSSRVEKYCEEHTPSLLQLISYILRIETIKINSETARTKKDLESLCYSYIYNMGLNLDLPIYPLRYFDEFVSHTEIRIRRAKPEEIEPPKRIYYNDLVLFYQQAIVSENLDNQFLSFYHIFEHFFEEIYNEDLIFSVRNELSKGSFSHKRKKDINKLVNIVKRKLKYKNDEFLLQEDEALILTLKKFLDDIDDLKQELIEIDPNLLDYFKTTEVIFSRGNKVNFESEIDSGFFKNLAKRIYLTRNAIVHSKESEKNQSKYLPFKDDKHLIKENILMRLIAERIIFRSSKDI